MDITAIHYIYASMFIATAHLLYILPIYFEEDETLFFTAKVYAASAIWHMLLVSWPLTLIREFEAYLKN